MSMRGLTLLQIRTTATTEGPMPRIEVWVPLVWSLYEIDAVKRRFIVVVERGLNKRDTGLGKRFPSYRPFSFGPHLLAKGQKETCLAR